MLIEVPWPVAVALDALVWATWSLVVGRWMAARHWTTLSPRSWITRLRSWESPQRYERWFRVRAWHDRLPEAGSWFGGLSKRSLPSAGEGGWRRFEGECLRAERTHWGILAVTPVFVVWNPPGLLLAMVLYGLVANVPCIVVLRWNRLRLAALRRRADQRERA